MKKSKTKIKQIEKIGKNQKIEEKNEEKWKNLKNEEKIERENTKLK